MKEASRAARLREALLFGLLSLAPLAALKAVTQALQAPETVTITITFTNGDTVVYTGCSDYSNNGTVVRFKIGDVVHEINWASVQEIKIVK